MQIINQDHQQGQGCGGLRRAQRVGQVLVALVLLVSCSSGPLGLFGEEERDFFTQQEYDEFNRWCLDVAENTAAKCIETADLIRFSVNEADYAKVDEDCLVWEMQRDVIGFGLYNSWDCIEE